MEACEALLGNARRLHEAAVQELEATRARQAQLIADLGRTVAAVRVKVSAAKAAVQDAVDREAAVDDVMKAATVRAAALGACRSEVEAAIEACGGRGVDVTTVGEEEKVVILDAWRCVDVELEEEPAGIHTLVEVRPSHQAAAVHAHQPLVVHVLLDFSASKRRTKKCWMRTTRLPTLREIWTSSCANESDAASQ